MEQHKPKIPYIFLTKSHEITILQLISISSEDVRSLQQVLHNTKQVEKPCSTC